MWREIDQDGGAGAASGARLPLAVEQLAPRMREIATIVYLNGVATLREIQARIDDDVSVYGLRTLLNRMVRRGILARRRSGRHSEIAYLPGIITDDIRAAALERLIESDFDGSVQAALVTSMRVAQAGGGEQRPSL